VYVNEKVREFARLYVQAGFSVIPIRTDGSKGAPIPWKAFQHRRPSQYEIGQLFRNDVGIAILGGKISGSLELIDFDRADLIDLWIIAVEKVAPGLIGRLPRVRTPKGGAHFYYRCREISGNEKLAQESPFDDAGNPRPNTLIETRGEGGYVLAPGSPPSCHSRNLPYEHVSGPPIVETPEITPEERLILLESARAFNTWTPPVVDRPAGGPILDPDRIRPGDDYNARASWREILEPAGWTLVQQVGDSDHWRRPGKTDRGTSATTGHCGDCLYVFSSNATPFSSGTAYTKFAAYSLLNHGGDFHAAADALKAAGYGNHEKAAKEVAEFSSAAEEELVKPKPAEPDKPSEPTLGTPQKDYHEKRKKKKGGADRFFDGKTFLPELLAQEICSEYRFISTPIGDDGMGTRVYVYQDGAFRPGGESVIVDEAHAALGERSNENRVKDVVKNIRISKKLGYEYLNQKAGSLINVRNGMLDWKNGELLPHGPEYLSTIQIDADYDPSSKSEPLDRFFESVLPVDEISIVEEFIGYLLVPDTSFNKCLVFVGEGGNGKTQFMNLIMGLLGEKNISHYSLHHISEEKFSVSGLFGSLANFYDELQTKQIKDTATFKMVTDGNPIKAEDKGKAPFSFVPYCRLVFATNEMPKSDDRSQAYFDRFIFIQLPNRIRGTRVEIRKYAQVLLQMPGVRSAFLNRALSGLHRLTGQNRFSTSESSTAAIEEYRRECNSAYDFIKEHCTFDDPTAWIPKRDVYLKYRSWCMESGRRPMADRGFSKSLENMNVRELRHKDARGWGGIAWINGQPPKTASDEVKEFGISATEEPGPEQSKLDF
jgi:P4 family phage/plasmid primase-like protien